VVKTPLTKKITAYLARATVCLALGGIVACMIVLVAAATTMVLGTVPVHAAIGTAIIAVIIGFVLFGYVSWLVND
jgi:hypothetical protein